MAQPSLNEWVLSAPQYRDWTRTFRLGAVYISDKPPAKGKVVVIKIITSDGRFLIETIEYPDKPHLVGAARWTSVRAFADRYIERKEP